MSEQSLEKIDPAALAALMTPEEIADFNANFSAGVAADFLPQLSIRGGKWRLKIGGEEEVIPGQTLNVLFVGSRPCTSKSFYLGGYDPKAEQKGPDCSSTDGNYPDANIENPQAPNCQICENNAWGSRGGGSKGKACSDYKQIVVTLADVAPETAFGLRIPPTSFKPFRSYIEKLKMAGAPANAAITKLTLGDEEYPTLSFDFAGLVDRGTFDKLKAVANSAEVQQVIHIQPRALKAAEPEKATAQQPVVVETQVVVAPENTPEPEKPEVNNALADLLAKNKTTAKKRSKKTVEEVVEVESTAGPVVEAAQAIVDSPKEAVAAAPITDMTALMAKLKSIK